jgi:hypothetical protein
MSLKISIPVAYNVATAIIIKIDLSETHINFCQLLITIPFDNILILYIHYKKKQL